jgi:hypothetical protein
MRSWPAGGNASFPESGRWKGVELHPLSDTRDSGDHHGQASNAGTESILSRTTRGLPHLNASAFGLTFVFFDNLKNSSIKT